MDSQSLQTLGPGVHPVLHGASKAQLPEGQLFGDAAEQRILGSEQFEFTVIATGRVV